MGKMSKKTHTFSKCKCRLRRIHYVMAIILFVITITIATLTRQLHIDEPVSIALIDRAQERSTSNPTTNPSPSPTPSPTLQPTDKPTTSPTVKPSSPPTQQPITITSTRRDVTSSPAWTVNWTLAASPHNLTAHNVSWAIRWHDPLYTGHCGIALFPKLSNAAGVSYLWVHDVMSIEMASQVWILATDPSAVFARPTQPPLWLGLYKSQLICAFNDGTTLLSQEIKFMRRKNLDFLVVLCDIPSALRQRVLSSAHNTTVGVTLLDSRNRSLNIRDALWRNVTLPVCATLVVNRGRHVHRFRF